ncbi:MAG: ATP-binding protein [Betaproteobacteria bacterium]|nr:ATP-binding protein [Betaproteobacteria bacterium]
MTKTMDSWFFMRPGFTSFQVQPERIGNSCSGPRDRAQRSHLLEEIEGSSYSGEGHKAVVFGDYGRGKTHLCHNLCFEIQRREMGILPVYIMHRTLLQRTVQQSLQGLVLRAKIPMGLISQALKTQLTDSREFGAVMRGLAHMLVMSRKKVPVYFIDEAERFQDITNVDISAGPLPSAS